MVGDLQFKETHSIVAEFESQSTDPAKRKIIDYRFPVDRPPPQKLKDVSRTQKSVQYLFQ